MEGVLGSTTLFAGDFAIKNWALCNGQIMQISQNSALFSIIGTTYGGNGTTNFALPDLRGRTVVGMGQGVGTNNYVIGQTNGGEVNSMTLGQLPPHAHQLSVQITPVASNDAGQTTPVGGVFANTSELLYNPTGDSSFMPYNAALVLENTGTGSFFNTLHPVLALNYLICTAGVFPARS